MSKPYSADEFRGDLLYLRDIAKQTDGVTEIIIKKDSRDRESLVPVVDKESFMNPMYGVYVKKYPEVIITIQFGL